ncbi:SDR family oxidoreductase [Rhodohalobacter sp. 614A]|uniref:SDR family oxidoreductase n=1 Tax=Rhodohalobacter sp. 614A TaxID=2908649 RepID=UPI001F157DA9|nr:SDR family oxidoreductase [Rhodohalobacter sp. 614A]
MILITGANGHLGSAAIDQLLKKNPDADIAGLVRSEEKGKELKAKGVELRFGDYLDPASLEKAFDGIDVLAFISSGTLKDRQAQHKNVVDAAKKKGIRHIFYTGISKADERLSPLAFDHDATEKMIKDAGIPFTICRNTIYLEFFPMFWGNAIETGMWTFPGGGYKQNLALRSEMAEALGNALADHEKHQNKIYDFAASQAYTFDEYADAMSEAAGKKITYTDVSVDAFVEQLKKAGLPDEQIGMTQIVSTLFANGGAHLESNDMANLLGRHPKNILKFVKEAVTSKNENK